MNETIKQLHERISVRAFEDKAISDDIKNEILECAFQAPTAGNQMLYTILDITDQTLKDSLAVSCDNQPFIAKAPIVLVFLADCRRWYDTYSFAGASPREPEAGDILLACQDALIAAQNAVVAAQSFGLGSCYIGDILENAEKHRTLLDLDKYTIPISMLVMGYPTEQQKNRAKPKRFDRKYIVQENTYKRLSEEQIRDMFAESHSDQDFDFDDYIRKFCDRKYMSDFSREMSRSARVYMKEFLKT